MVGVASRATSLALLLLLSLLNLATPAAPTQGVLAQDDTARVADRWRAWVDDARATLQAVVRPSEQLGARLAEGDTAFLAKLGLLEAALGSKDLTALGNLFDQESLALLSASLGSKLACIPTLAVESPTWIDTRMTFGLWQGAQCVFGLRFKIACEKGKWLDPMKILPGYLVPGKLFLNKDVCVEELSTGLADSLVEQLAGYLP